MICKWCGSQFDGYSPVCPVCGNKPDGSVNENGSSDFSNTNAETVSPEYELNKAVPGTVYLDGYNAGADKTETNKDNGTAQDNNGDSNDSKKRKILIIEILAIVVAILALIGVLLFSMSAQPSKTKQNTTKPSVQNTQKPSENKVAVDTTAPVTTEKPASSSSKNEASQSSQQDEDNENSAESQNGDYNSEAYAPIPTNAPDYAEETTAPFVENSGGEASGSGGGGEESGGAESGGAESGGEESGEGSQAGGGAEPAE